MKTTEALLRSSVDPGNAGGALTLDRTFQGLPGIAHGGSVLAVLDAVAALQGSRRVSGIYRRRVPLGVRLALETERTGGVTTCRVRDGRATLVDGRVAPAELPVASAPVVNGRAGTPLPISGTCFVCGVDNAAGLRAQLRFDEDVVEGVWTPPAHFRGAQGGLAPVALTSLLDEVAFWLGALASGESGMTTDLAVTLADRVALDGPLRVSGERARVRPTAADPRYWQTHALASDATGRVVASADVTFVALRGAARNLGAWLSPLNSPELLARIFPSYA